jgi:integrase
VTTKSVSTRKFQLNNRRERYLSTEEENRLMSMLIGRRAYLRPIVILALNTGMRRGEILNLEWWQIDFSTDCHQDQERQASSHTDESDCQRDSDGSLRGQKGEVRLRKP